MELQIPLEPGDTVITAFQFRDKIVVITDMGKVWTIEVGESFNPHEIFLRLQ